MFKWQARWTMLAAMGASRRPRLVARDQLDVDR